MAITGIASAALVSVLWILAWSYRRKLAEDPPDKISLFASWWVTFLSLIVVFMLILSIAFGA
jgi:hypothetical protein